MGKLGIAFASVLSVVALAGCGAGKYKHGIGNCIVRNGDYMVQVYILRDKGKSDAKGSQILQAVCDTVHQELSK